MSDPQPVRKEWKDDVWQVDSGTQTEDTRTQQHVATQTDEVDAPQKPEGIITQLFDYVYLF